MVLPEMKKANHILIEKQLGMKKGDEMLIPTREQFLEVAISAQRYADNIGVKTYLVVLPQLKRREYRKGLQSLANQVDGIYGLGYGYNYRVALDHDTRILNIFSTDEPIVRTTARVDIQKMKDDSWRIRDAITDADTLRITCPNGSDFTEDISQKIGHTGTLWAGEQWEAPFEYAPIGYPGYHRHRPLGTCNGTLVFDFWPPLGVLNTPITCTIEKDVIVDVKGGWEAGRFWDRIKDWPEKYLAEMQLGINPNARIVNWSGPEWERYRGAIHFGLGSIMPYPCFGEYGKLVNPDWKPSTHHTDGMLVAPTLTVDNTVICKNGIMQPPFA
jgi:leucyl aminopeptidase (aminopeptidase T)